MKAATVKFVHLSLCRIYATFSSVLFIITGAIKLLR